MRRTVLLYAATAITMVLVALDALSVYFLLLNPEGYWDHEKLNGAKALHKLLPAFAAPPRSGGSCTPPAPPRQISPRYTTAGSGGWSTLLLRAPHMRRLPDVARRGSRGSPAAILALLHTMSRSH